MGACLESSSAEPRRVYLDLLDAYAGRAFDVLDVLRDRNESGLRCRHNRHVVHVRARGAPLRCHRIVEGDELVLSGYAIHSGRVGCALHEPLLGVPARVVVTEEVVAEGSHEEHRPRVVARVPERGLRFKPGDLGHAFQYNGPLDRLKRVLRVEYLHSRQCVHVLVCFRVNCVFSPLSLSLCVFVGARWQRQCSRCDAGVARSDDRGGEGR